VQIETFSHRRGSGWSAPLPAGLDSAETLVLVFGAPAYGEAPAELAELAAAFPESRIVGCSSAGEIHAHRVADDTLVVAIARFARTKLAVATSPVPAMCDSLAAGARLGALLAAHAPQLVLVFSDGLAVNGSDLVKGLSGSLPEGTMICGGLAADGNRFQRTWVLVDGQPQSGFVTAVALSGTLVVGAGSQGGWGTFGPERKITHSQGNVLFELDGKPALALYKEYLGELASELPASALRFPLAVRDGPESATSVVRTILAVDEATQSLTFAGDIPNGGRARLMRANNDRLIVGAMRAAVDATEGLDDQPALAVAISCVGRRLVLGARTEEETEAALEALPSGSHQIGFYAYGEISPGGFDQCGLHNQTMTLTALREITA